MPTSLIIDEILHTHHPLQSVAAKVMEEQRLCADDGLALLQSRDLLAIGALADRVRRNRVGEYAYFVQNCHLNPTNLCVLTCHFCAFKRRNGEDEAYLFTLDQVREFALRVKEREITEIHIVGGVTPEADLNYYTQLLRELKQALPEVHLKALTAVEIDFLARKDRLSCEETLKCLQEAGLDSLPGGGAEIFSPRVRQEVCPGKLPAEGWLKVHETAHRLGLHSTATMLCGLGETNGEKVDHILQIRDLQDRTGGFTTFIPLVFHPTGTDLAHYPKLDGITILKNLAVSRLLLDNVPHIKAYWVQTGLKLAQLALAFGADDLDGTIVEERITHAAGAETDRAVEKSVLIETIRRAGRIPVLRDTLYNHVRVYQ